MLQKCSDCGKEYSTVARACPNCGRPNQIYLDMNSSYQAKQTEHIIADAAISQSFFQMKSGLLLLLITCGLTYLFIHSGLAPTKLESQSFMEFISNPSDWFNFYTSFLIVFYRGVCILFCGGFIRGSILYFIVGLGVSSIGPTLPPVVQKIVIAVFILFPFYLMVVRPIMMLCKAGYFTFRRRKVRYNESDRFIHQMKEAD